MSSLQNKLKIDIVLPAKEAFSETNAGAVGTYVHDIIKASTALSKITVFGRHVDKPFPNINFVPLKPKMSWLLGKNMGLSAAYLHQIGRQSQPDLIEIHGRCNVASYLAKKRPDIPISLFLPNDPRGMKGSKSVLERQKLLKDLVQIVCVSHYVRNCFLEGLNVHSSHFNKVSVFPIGVDRKLQSPPIKEPIIFIAGRMVAEKGILEAATALAKILPFHPK